MSLLKKKIESSGVKVSGSDQAVTIRDIGQPVMVPLAGNSYELRPGSLYFHGVLTRWKAAFDEKIALIKAETRAIAQTHEFIAAWNILNKIWPIDEQLEQIAKRKAENLEFPNDDDLRMQLQAERLKLRASISPEQEAAYQKYLVAFAREAPEVEAATMEYGLQTVQLLLLNSKERQWYKQEGYLINGMPSQNFLNQVIDYEVLYKEAAEKELDNVVLTFIEINKPMLFLKNVEALTGVQSISRGQG